MTLLRRPNAKSTLDMLSQKRPQPLTKAGFHTSSRSKAERRGAHKPPLFNSHNHSFHTVSLHTTPQPPPELGPGGRKAERARKQGRPVPNHPGNPTHPPDRQRTSHGQHLPPNSNTLARPTSPNRDAALKQSLQTTREPSNALSFPL